MFDQALLLLLVRRQRDQSVANQIGGGFVSGVEQKDAVVQQFLFAQPLAIVLALNEACQHVAFRIAWFGPSPRHQNFEVAKGIVENQAGGVVLIKRRIAVFRREFLFLVGRENPGVLVGGDQIVIAREEIRTVREQLDRLVLPQCTIGRIGVGIEFRRQLLDVESGRQLSRVRIHAVILFEGDGYAGFAISESRTEVTVAPEYSLA